MENDFVSYEGISACWIEKCTFISGIVAIALVLQQRDAPGQLALATAGRRTEYPGYDLAGGSVVCHRSISGGAQVQSPSRPEGPSSGERRGTDGAVLTEVIGS